MSDAKSLQVLRTMGAEERPWAFRRRVGGRKVVLIRDHWEVGRPNGKGIAIVFGEDEANVELIIRAVNRDAAFEDMVKALQSMDEFAWSAVSCDCQEAHDGLAQRLKQARNALASARTSSNGEKHACPVNTYRP